MKTSLKLEIMQPHNQMTSKSFVICTSLHYLCQKRAFALPLSRPTTSEGDTSEVDRPRSSLNQWSHTLYQRDSTVGAHVTGRWSSFASLVTNHSVIDQLSSYLSLFILVLLYVIWYFESLCPSFHLIDCPFCLYHSHYRH